MNEDQLRQLRGYQRGLEGQLGALSHEHVITTRVVESGAFRLFIDEVERARAAFPEIMPTYREGDFLSHHSQSRRESYYHVTTMRQYLGMAIGKLRAVAEEVENTPITQPRDFSFVKDARLRAILERDYEEIQRAAISRCWKSVIILSGGAIEAILADLLLQQSAKALAAKAAPKESDITKWDLSHLIAVALELHLVSAAVERLSNPVREYRNLVHPGNEVRSGLIFGGEEAKIALEVLHIVHRDLSK